MMGKQMIWTKPPTETLLRLSVLVFWLMQGVETFANPEYLAEVAEKPHRMVVGLVLFFGFGLAFWLNTRNITAPILSWRPVVLLTCQLISGFVIHTNLLYIVAAEIPLVLPQRAAGIWFGAQTLLLIVLIFWLDQTGQGHLEFMTLPQLPHLLVIVLTDIAVFALHGFAFLMGYLVTTEAHGRRAAERCNAELVATQELLAQSSRIAERAYVARELHDSLGHHLVALKVNLELAQQLAQNPAKSTISDALGIVVGLLSDVREVVGQVRTKPTMNLRQAIETLLTGISEFSVDLVYPEALEIPDPNQAHMLFRCIQEAITNAIKYAQANKLRIEFANDQFDITLTIADDGKGVSQLIPGYGIKGMHERLQSVGGSLNINHDRGFTLLIRLPKSRGLPI